MEDLNLRQAPPAAALSDTVVRATLCPLLEPDSATSGPRLGAAVAMRLSRLSVGAHGGCDAPLDAARCRRVSPLHATIFYDEVTDEFELINYSEWGTLVNGVLYACDLPERAAPTAAHSLAPTAEPAPTPAPALADLLGDRLRPREYKMRGSRALCGCPAAPAGAAWEGSALLAHGALLQFGCLRYVFCRLPAPAPVPAQPDLDG